MPRLYKDGALSDVLGFVFPVYAWAPPRLVTEFVEKLVIEEKPSYVYMVCTCGDEAGYTESIFRKALAKKELTLDAAFSFVMPETYINLPGFRLDTDERVKEKFAEVDRRLPKVIAAINSCEKVSDVWVGPLPGFKSYVLQPLFYGCLITDRKFRVGESCNGCGTCARVCPLHNIIMCEGRPKWSGNCTNCMACYHNCPQNAINWGRQTVGKGQYQIKKIYES